MILPEAILPKKEVYLDDIKKSLSFPGSMHEDDIKFSIDVNEYGKSPRQSIMQILANSRPILSDDEYIAMGEKAKSRLKAVPEFLGAVGTTLSEDVKDVGEFLTTGKVTDSPERIKARETIVSSGAVLADSIFETFVGRLYEPVRAFAGDIIRGERSEIPRDMARAFVDPSLSKKISSPESIPFTQEELEGGISALIPRAVASGIEDVIIYGGAWANIPKMIENYEINSARNLMRKSTEKIHQHVMDKLSLSSDEAWAYMNQPQVVNHIQKAAQQAIKQKQPTLYSGVPAPRDPKEAVKAVGEELAKSSKKAVVRATVGEAIKQRGFVSSVQDEMPQLKVSGQYVPRSTDELAQKARNLIKDDISVAEQMARTGTDDASIATGAELLKHYTEMASKADPATANVLYDKAAELGNSMAERLTELGRSVQAAAILARQTPEGQIRFAAQSIKRYNDEVEKNAGMFGVKKKIPELNGDQARFIRDKMEEISKLPEGEMKAIKWKELQDYISDLVPTPLYKKIVTIWKAGLLTGFKTSGLNIFSNASHAFGTEVLKDIPAVAVDKVASLFTGKRAIAFTVRGIPGGAKEGFEKGWRFLRTSYDERNVLGKLDYKRISFGKGKFAKGLQAYEETVFKILGAEDQVFYYGTKARSIAEQAIVRAKNQGLKGKAKDDFIQETLENPPNDILVMAISDAEAAVFQNETFISKAGSAIQKIPGAEFVLPFSKTPSAVAMQIVNYSPAGFIKTALNSFKSGEFQQRDFSKGMGRSLLGLPILWLGYQMYNSGEMNLDKPKSEKEKELWKLEGRKANTVKIGDKWRSIQVLGPAGNLLLIGGQFSKALETSGSPSEAMAKTVAGGAKSFSEQTFLKGMSSAVDAVTDPEKSAEYFLSGLISSAVPTISADIAKATDQTERRTEDIPSAIANRIPLLRGFLEPQIDVLGRERIIKENFFEIMFDPTRPSKEIKEPVVQEIRRLVEDGFDISTTLLGNREGYKILTPEQNTELWQRAGGVAYDKISEYMKMESYDETPDEQKAKDIDKFLDKSKILARVEKVMELTIGLEGEELNNKLSELKKDGLLNGEVFKKWDELR